MKTVSFDTFRDYVLKSAESVQSLMVRPTDDWEPMLLIHSSKGGAVLQIDTAFFASAASKAHFADVVLPEHLLEHCAEMFAFVISGWLARPSERDEAYRQAEGVWHRRAEQMEGAAEVVSVYVLSGDQEELWTAEIERTPDKPPTLGFFRLTPPFNFEGRYEGARAYLHSAP